MFLPRLLMIGSISEFEKIILSAVFGAAATVIASLLVVGVLERRKIRAANEEKEEAIAAALYKDLVRNKALLKAILNFVLPRPDDGSSIKDIQDEIKIAKSMLRQLNFDQFDYFYEHERPALYKLRHGEDLRIAYEELKKLQKTEELRLKELRAHISSVANHILKGDARFKAYYSEIAAFLTKNGLTDRFVSVTEEFFRIQALAYEETEWVSREETDEE